MAETGINLNEINFNHGDHDYQDIEKTFNEMDGYDAVKIIIEIPAKYQDQVIEFIANGEDKTLKGYGRGVLKRCGLL